MTSKHLPSEGVDWSGFLRVYCTFSGGVEGPLGQEPHPQECIYIYIYLVLELGLNLLGGGLIGKSQKAFWGAKTPILFLEN